MTQPTQPSADLDSPAGQTKKFTAWWTSFVFLGLILYMSADNVSRFVYHPDPFETPYRSWIAAAVQDLPRQGPKPDILILGSSLMVAAVNDGDATTTGQAVDGTVHHRSLTLENDLDPKPLSQSFAIGGQMASDAYAILRSIYADAENARQEPSLASANNRERKSPPPQIIVWGIAPRDFLDATFTDPYSSTTVTYLDKLDPRADALGTRKPYFWRELEIYLGRLSNIYKERDHFVSLQKTATYNLLAKLDLVKEADLGTVQTPQEVLRIARRELPEDNGLRQWMVKPQTEATGQFEDNSKEYLARYVPFKEKLFNGQIDYLQKFLLLARGLGIKVVLVNMPLTKDNMVLIPEGRYEQYLSTVRTMAQANGATLLDYNDGKSFSRQYFNDLVHLNGFGSQKFFARVARDVAPMLTPPTKATGDGVKK